MAFEVAELTAQLRAEVATFRANLAAADASIAVARQALRDLEAASVGASGAMNEVKIGSAQAYETKAALDTMERSLSPVTRAAIEAANQMAEVKLSAAAAAETVANAEIEKRALKSVEDQAVRSRLAARGGGGGGGGLFAGILPGGARPGPAAVGLGIGLAAAAGPAIVPAAVGLGTFGASAIEGLVGGALTLKLALGGITSAAFSTQKAFDALTPAQQQFVQTLRSLDAGIVTRLEGVAQGTVLPGLTSGLQSAVSPAALQTLTQGTQSFANALSQGAQAWGQLFGSQEFQSSFGPVMQANARYLGNFVDSLSQLFDGLVHLQQAAIPFTDWINGGVSDFATWADGAANAAAASGSFARFLDQAKEGLQALGGLLESVGHLLIGLNDASGIGVAVGVIHDLQAAVQTLANFLEQNQGIFKDVLTGAVQAANDLVTAINGILVATHPLLVALNDVANAVGGWRVVFDGVLVYFTATFAQRILLSLAGVGAAEAGVTAGATEASGAMIILGGSITTTGVAAGAATAEVSGLRGALLALGGADILKVLGGLAANLSVLAGPLAILTALQSAPKIEPYIDQQTGRTILENTPGQFTVLSPKGLQGKISPTSPEALRAAAYYRQQRLAQSKAATGGGGGGAGAGGDNGVGVGLFNPMFPSEFNTAVQTGLIGTSAFGVPPPLTQTTTGTGVPRGLNILPAGLQAALAAAQQNAAASSFGGTSASALQAAGPQQVQARVDALKALVNVEAQAYDYLLKQHATGKELAALERERVALAKELAGDLGRLSSITTAQATVQAQQRVTSQQERLLGIGPNAVPGVQSIQRRERSMLLSELRGASPGQILPTGAAGASIQGLIQMIQSAGVTLPASTLRSLNLIHRVLQLQLTEQLKGMKLDPNVVQNLDTRLTEINTTLKDTLKAQVSGYHVPTEQEMTAGLHLSPAQRRAVGARLAAVAELRGKVPGGPTAFGIPIAAGQTQHSPYSDEAMRILTHPVDPHGATVIRVQGDLVIPISGQFDNPKAAAREIARELGKTARRNATQTRGPNAGRNRGLT